MLPALAALRGRYTLGFATNGNSRAERCGLAGEFAFELYAHENGLPKKPAPEFYAAVVAAAGVPAGADRVRRRLAGTTTWSAPQRAGLRSVWLNRLGLPRPPGVPADAEVSTMAELPARSRICVPVPLWVRQRCGRGLGGLFWVASACGRVGGLFCARG